MKKMERKKLSDTKGEIVIGKDKCRKCKELLEWSRVYPFDVYCPMCHKGMEYEDEIIFHKKSPMKNDVKNHNKTKDNVDEYVEEKVTKFIKLLLGGLPDGLECKHLEDFIRQIINECKARVSKEKIFVQHIENHLKTMGIKGKVICKICGKDIDTIADEEVIE